MPRKRKHEESESEDEEHIAEELEDSGLEDDIDTIPETQQQNGPSQQDRAPFDP